MAAATSPVRSLELIVLRRLDGLLQGDYRGLLPGHGSERSDARAYVPGDDPRRIDWPVTARTGETHVRDTIADHELELWLVLDTSASFAFGTAESEKAAVARDLAGTLGLVRGARREPGRLPSPPVRVWSCRPAPARAHLAAVLGALRPPADGTARRPRRRADVARPRRHPRPPWWW